MKIGKAYKELASKILGSTLTSYYNYANQNRPIISLLEKYFTKEELEEFLATGKIQKQELIKDKTLDELKNAFKNEHNQKILTQIEELKKQLI